MIKNFSILGFIHEESQLIKYFEKKNGSLKKILIFVDAKFRK